MGLGPRRTLTFSCRASQLAGPRSFHCPSVPTRIYLSQAELDETKAGRLVERWRSSERERKQCSGRWEEPERVESEVEPGGGGGGEEEEEEAEHSPLSRCQFNLRFCIDAACNSSYRTIKQMLKRALVSP